MEANELMIGDYLRTRFSKKIIRVKEIKQSCIYTEDNGYEYNEIEPIPLTTEILEKNGFGKYPFHNIKGQHQWSWWLNMSTCVSLWYRELNDDPKDGMMVRVDSPLVNICIRVDYLHQLQHAIKLCGIEKEIEL